MMMAGGGGAAVDHNGIYSTPNLHSLQQPLMEADNPDSRKRPLETPAEEAGCTKRTNIGGKRDTQQEHLLHMVSNMLLQKPLNALVGVYMSGQCMQRNYMQRRGRSGLHVGPEHAAPVQLAL